MSIEKIVSLCKRRGFVFQSSEIYGGFGAIYDYGPLGISLKNNISQLWWKAMTQLHENIVKHFGCYAGYAQQFLFKMERELYKKKWL